MDEKTASLILALMGTGKLSLQDVATLYGAAGSAAAVLEHRHDIRQIAPEATEKLLQTMRGDIADMERRAEEERGWCERNGIRILCIGEKDYPQRLRHCNDAPMALFVRGTTDLNSEYIVNLVGTRKCTTYGQDVTAGIVGDLAALCPGVVIVSGLAYGIDITAHRAALQNGLRTVGVVAHGQDILYPARHAKEAREMVTGTGAVLTEFFHGTRPIAHNFLQRNRLIAGMADATIVVESASHGGGLVTARLAQDYGREVFAVPGPVNAEFSRGCNNLIRDNKAALISSADDLISLMQWQRATQIGKARKMGIEREMFAELSPEEQLIVEALRRHGDSQTNALAMHVSLPISAISASLFSLEMKGIIKPMAGNAYHLIG